MRTAATRTAALIGALVVWAAFTSVNARLGWINPVLLPTPVDVGRATLDLLRSGELIRHLLTSLARVAEGFGLAAARRRSASACSSACACRCAW